MISEGKDIIDDLLFWLEEQDHIPEDERIELKEKFDEINETIDRLIEVYGDESNIDKEDEEDA